MVHISKSHFDVKEIGEWVIIQVGTDYLTALRPTLEELESCTNNLLDQGHFQLCINFEQVVLIDSRALGHLVSVYNRCEVMKGCLKICCLTPQVLRVLEVTKLDRKFKIYKSEEAALSSK